MADIYHKVGSTFRTSFMYLDDTGAPVTGLTSAAFTVQATKNNAHLVVAGVTLAEVASATEPGLYSVDVSAATGFPSAVGVYELIIYRTSTVYHRWTQTIRVTTDGTGTGTYGTVSFTATASDGRVMSGGSPLADATIRIVDSNGILVAQTTSTASGLWTTPVWFAVDGTYTIYVQKSGYTTATGSIIISGSATVATGPATDLSITAVSSSSGLTASGLWAHFKRVLRDRSGSQADLLAQQGVDDALTMISQECEWLWYHTAYPITLQASYSTGTIAIAAGSTTCTLTTGTWPTWAASGDLYIDGQWYTIASRTSGSVVVLDVAWGQAALTASTFIIAQCSYTLPSDVQSIDGIRYDRTWAFSPTACSMATLTLARMAGQYTLGRPTMWAVQRDQFVVWPLPSEQKTLNLLYYRRPAFLASASDAADWDPMHLTLLRRAIEYQAALRGDCVVGTAEECLVGYRNALTKAMQFDKGPTDRDQISVDRLNDGGMDNWWRGTITP